MKHRFTEECLVLFNANGTFRKTQKSKLLQKLIHQPQEITSYTVVVDMGMIWRLAAPTVEDRDKGDGSPYTWGDYANKMTSMILARHKDANSIICVNDPYGQTESIKYDERELRIQGHGHIPNVFMKAGDAFPSAREFNTIMCISGNKKRLQTMIKAQLTGIAPSIKQEVLYSVGEECTSLSSGTSLDELSFSQSEADTIMLSCYVTLRSQGNDDPFVIDAADTDVYVQAAAISHEIPGILCIRKKNELLTCRSMCTDQNVAKCLIPCHVMTGCDANSCFYGHGKLTLFERVTKSAEARSLLLKCGESLELSDDALNDLKIYVMRYVYGDVRCSSLDVLRAEKWRCQKKKSLMRQPPDDDCLKQHITRANFLAYIQRHHELRDHPSPVGYGWTLVNGRCRPERHTQQALPPELHTPSTLQAGDGSSGDESESEESDLPYSESDLSD